MRPNTRTGHRILICHPDPLGGRLLSNLIRTWGYTPELVAAPEEILDGIEDGGIDVVLVDCGPSSSEVLDLIKLVRFARLGEPHLPVILITPSPHGGCDEAFASAGIDAVLVKPLAPAELAAGIAAVLAPGNRVRQRRSW